MVCAMAKLIYSAIASLDGYVADAEGKWDWSVPDREVHAVVNDQEREIGTYLYGRRMYEVMVAWETMATDGEPYEMRDYAEIWRAAEKVVFSSTLAEATSARTRIERSFDPEAIRALKAGADRDISIGGPELAAHALRAGLVDELSLFLSPVSVGGGKRALPEGTRIDLELLGERRFANGAVAVRYRVR
jgi:dihydrofolate reductase